MNRLNEISCEQIEQLNQYRLTKLLLMLLRAEAKKYGLFQSTIAVSTKINVGGGPVGHDMPHGNSANDFRIGDQSAVATPPERFRTHHAHPVQSPAAVEFLQCLFKCFGLHVIGVRAKTGIVPRRIDGCFF